MRLMVLFDMPVGTKEERREYAHFRDYIQDDAFEMLQYSVYTRFCQNDSDCDKHVKRILDFKPKFGNIRMIKLTDNQFTNMIMVAGEKTEQEEAQSAVQLTII